jgi:hypothetical protein
MTSAISPTRIEQPYLRRPGLAVRPSFPGPEADVWPRLVTREVHSHLGAVAPRGGRQALPRVLGWRRGLILGSDNHRIPVANSAGTLRATGFPSQDTPVCPDSSQSTVHVNSPRLMKDFGVVMTSSPGGAEGRSPGASAPGPRPRRPNLSVFPAPEGRQIPCDLGPVCRPSGAQGTLSGPHRMSRG